ncbi:MAG: T9SS type A sorting domain-containing protein [candidate division WOR-3 bacterium]|nr:MAG: T9SS type A sorting domain-containing protein [candidate division WOR-3 bacterium]
MHRYPVVVLVCAIAINALYGGSLCVVDCYPAQRSMASMISDTVNHRIIMYGGQDYNLSGDCYDEIWAFDPSLESWQQVEVTSPTPPPRRNPSLILDPTTNQMFMFGGRSAYTFYNDIWRLDLTLGAEYWTQLTPSGTPPCPRTEVTGIYDPVSHRLIFFGGDIGGGIRLNETWELDLTTMAWTQLGPSGPLPIPRSACASVYDQTQHRIIVFSGCATPMMSDVWALDLTYGNENWEQLYPSGPTPQCRGQAFCAYDEVQNALIVGFGYEGSPYYIILLSDVYALNLTDISWQQVVPSGTVAPRRGSCGSYSPENGLVYIFGGDAGVALATTFALYTDPVGIAELIPKPMGEDSPIGVAPNPLVLPCQIETFMQRPGELCMNIYDNSGRLIRTMIEPEQTAGTHTINWDGLDGQNRPVPAGTYFIQVNIDGVPKTKKVVLIE